jgi:ATP-binding cassette subfamily G (WHITE) protein 2 (PDR)
MVTTAPYQSDKAHPERRMSLGDGLHHDEQPEQIFDPEEANAEIQRIATQLSTGPSAVPALFPIECDSKLDPHSPKFDARAWAKAFYKARSDALEGASPRKAGFAFKDLNVFGYGSSIDFQKDVTHIFLEAYNAASRALGQSKKQRVDILRDVEGVVEPGEMLCVLGPPGSGCSTFLKSIAGDTHGFHVDKQATLNYHGIRSEQMKKQYRGEAIYTAEVDNHFPHLTVGDTLYFAAQARRPDKLPNGASPHDYAEHLRDVIMAMFGISHTRNTRVGDDFVRGVSGGERKRVTIAEAALGYSPLQCWDNSTRGLDSANAIEFCRTLRTQADVLGCTSLVAIYQAPQAAYNVFDKVIVLYEGRQIYFGRADEARAYFEELGFVCPDQMTTPDFLTSMTSPVERVIRKGWESRTPQTADDFARVWKQSETRRQLLGHVDRYVQAHPFDGEDHHHFALSRKMDQSNMQRQRSPFNLSYFSQIKLTLWRNWVLLKGDPSLPLTMLVCNTAEALVIGSIFYNLPEDTTSLFKRGMLLFWVILMNALGSILEILTLYAKRKIVEKHARYAFYHPSAEAISAIITDLPYKIVNTLLIDLTVYFMGNLHREPGPFFFFFLFTFGVAMSMSWLFRFLASVTKSLEQALAPSTVMLTFLVLFCGFALPINVMPVWLGWTRWINPIFYGLESLFINEYKGRRFTCSSIIPSGPGYDSVSSSEQVCSVAGSLPGESDVSGEAYLKATYDFVMSRKWSNIGPIIAFALLFLALHLLTLEYVMSERSKGEVLVFTRSAMKKQQKTRKAVADVEANPDTTPEKVARIDDSSSDGLAGVDKQTSVFHWKDVCYEVQIKDETRRILDNVDGWVKPGTLTALMGVSGAGKTTLLDVLASRVTMGVVTGSMLVDGAERDSSFQRKTGYVQQQDLHPTSSTVREALVFSALLRQPAKYTKTEKIAYVDNIIRLLEMEEYADAVIGVPGEGLNVEQRKRLTIGVELVARPQLLLFLDEPTSGLDSQTSWSICNLMEKLTNSGQAILCTIHQPSAMLFQRFDRLLLLAKGGKTVYFGDIGKDSHILMDYFTRNGGPALPSGANPAEHMLEVIGAAPGAQTDIDWPAVWRASPEYGHTHEELDRLSSSTDLSRVPTTASRREEKASQFREFAAPFPVQLSELTKRVYKHLWRSPSYIYSRFIMSAGLALGCGLALTDVNNSMRGMQVSKLDLSLFGGIFSTDMFIDTNVRSVLLDHDFPADQHPDVSRVLQSADLVRGSRAPLQDILLAGIHAGKHYCRSYLEFFDVNLHLLAVVLSHPPISQCRVDRHSPLTSHDDPSHCLGVLHLHLDIRPHAHCRSTKPRHRRWHSHAHFHHHIRSLRRPRWSSRPSRLLGLGLPRQPPDLRDRGSSWHNTGQCTSHLLKRGSRLVRTDKRQHLHRIHVRLHQRRWRLPGRQLR